MIRSELFEALKLVEATLGAVKDPIPVNPCLCFTGEHVFAFNDRAALVAKLKTPWKGALRGATLLGWLGALKGKEIEATLSPTSVTFVSGRSRSEMPLLPETEFRFALPSTLKAPKVKLDAAALLALKRAALCLDDDPQFPYRRGLQLVFEKGKVTAMSFDEASAARTTFSAEVPKELVGAKPLLPPGFVELLLARTNGAAELTITSEWYSVSLKDGATLYSAVPTETSPETFDGLFASLDDVRKTAVPLPKTWWGAMSRLAILLSGDKGMGHAASELKDDKLVISALSALGQARESFKVEGAKFPVAALKIPPAIVSKAVGEVESFAFAEGPRLCLFGKTLDVIVAGG